ncbi:MAG: hypothetical protein LQ340_001890 [Diploschistes diacapsis]|nr:MAG: hypothetical protein LQ340_001890 [Diploschistes diacapsis]
MPPHGYEYTGGEPLNREPSTSSLISSFLSSTKTAYNRNHGPILHLSAAAHTVKVKGLVSQPLTLPISSLESDFPQHTVTCLLQCAGNRRHTMRTAVREVEGIDWFDAAVMNCTWTGPRLCDVLTKAGVNESKDRKLHVAFACHKQGVQKDSWYGGSIPLSRALRRDADVILALKQNGEPLTPEHGHPVRVIAPGVTGARLVKWLDEITVQEGESENFYQRRDYKVLPPEAVDQEAAKTFWDRTPSLMDLPINSAVGKPVTGDRVARDGEGMVEVRGYALPGGEDGPVVKVEVRVDRGEWQEAQLERGVEGGKWSWVLWKWRGVVEPGKRTIWSRARDKGGNMQDSERSQWNLRGVAYNGYGEAVIDVV